MNTTETDLKEEPAKPKKTRKPLPYRKIFKWGAWGTLVSGIFVFVFVGVFLIRATKDLPSIEALQQYSPAVMSRVQAGDGKLIAEYGIEKRVFVPIESIPKQIQHALVSSEDQRFYEHDGFDPKGFARAMAANLKHKAGDLFRKRKTRLEGGSTLTQQVAKHFLVGNERNIERKVREILIAKRIEKAISKEEILELYLNDVYFGRRAYGIAGASLNYFNKPLAELSLGQMAYLAGLVKGPNNYQPGNNMEKAINRRNYVLNRMAIDGYVTQDQADTAKLEELVIEERLFGEEYLAAEYFVAEVRKQINGLYGEDQLNEGGLSIRTTLDTKMQLSARTALRRGLEMYDRRHGYRGPLATLDTLSGWETALGEFEGPKDIDPWRLAVVLDARDKTAKIGLVFETEESEIETEEGTIALADIDWAKKALEDGKVGDDLIRVSQALTKGDIILVQVKPESESGTEYNLRQVPDVNGGIIAMDPHTGRVLSLVGGYSFAQNQFNRATQAYRQPGSAFKPFVYAAALDNGFTPVSQVLDAPFVIERNDREEGCEEDNGNPLVNFGTPDEDGQKPMRPVIRGSSEAGDKECGPVFYKPANFNAGRFYGLSTLRLGIEKSRNAMTVRLANDIGMQPIAAYGKSFGIYDDVKPELAWALGAGETTLLRMASAYAALVNGGKKVTPTLLDRVQDSTGKTILIHDQRQCPECRLDEWDFSEPPELPDEREEVLNPVTAYQITSMLEGVVLRGTGASIARLERPLGGKTGTTNDYKDAWFMGFSPDLVVGVYVGYDTPRPLGTETGSQAAAPIFRFFMGDVLADEPKVSFRIPEGVLLAPVNRITGEPSYIGAPDFIYEAFQPGTEPRLGGGRAKINIGSGAGRINDFNFGGGDDKEFEGLDAGPDSGEDTQEGGRDTDGVQDGTNPQIQPQPANIETEKKEEEALDDGLY
jgi:penicillin-binding protein 1A